MNNTQINAIEAQFFALNLARVRCNREFLRTLDKITDKLSVLQHAQPGKPCARCELEEEYLTLTEVYLDFKVTDLNLLEIENLKNQLRKTQRSIKAF